MSKGFPAKTRFKSYFVVIVSYWLFPTRNIFKFLINLTFSNCSILFKRTIVSSVLKVPLNPYQPVRMYRYVYSSYWLIFSKCCLTVSVFFSCRCRLPFVEATILELLRITTLGPLAMPHCTLKDTRVGGFFIPRGTTVSDAWHVLYVLYTLVRQFCKEPGFFSGGESPSSLSCSPNNGFQEEFFYYSCPSCFQEEPAAKYIFRQSRDSIYNESKDFPKLILISFS